MEAKLNPKNKYQKKIVDRKTCIVCGKEKSVHSFYDHCSSADGKANECKKCKILIDKEYYRVKKEEKDIKLHNEISRPLTDKENQFIADFIAKRDSK